MLRIPHCLRQSAHSGKIVSSKHWPHFTPQKLFYYFSVSGTHFCYKRRELQSVLFILVLIYNILVFTMSGACDSVDGLGIMLQAIESRVRFQINYLDVSIDVIIPAVLWP
jgi:hypothetical protein